VVSLSCKLLDRKASP